jgi:hypothetical protein
MPRFVDPVSNVVRLDDLRRRIHAAATRLQQPEWHWALAFICAGFYVMTSLYISAHRLLWFDEILTALISRLESTSTMLRTLSEVAEQTPPLYFLIARVFDQTFHHSDIGLRAPSAIALGAGLIVIFDTTRRLTNGLYGLIAMTFVATSFVTYYGHEARSYAIYFMLAAITLWLWTATKTDSKIAAAAFGAVFLVGVSVHYYFLLCLVPFGFAALVERRVFQPKIIAGTVGVMFAVAALYPYIAHARAFAKTISAAWAPSMFALFSACFGFLPNAILPAGMIAGRRIVSRKLNEHLVPPMSAGERVGWLFLLLPLSAYLVGVMVTHTFHDRYIIGAAPGIALAATCLLWRRFRQAGAFSLVLLLGFGACAIGQQVITLARVDSMPAESGGYQQRIRQILALEDTLFREGKQHVVVTWDVQYLETWYHSPRRHRYECFTAEDRWAIKRYVPLHFVSVEDIAANAKQTAIVSDDGRQTRGLREAMHQAGLETKVRFNKPQQILYLEQSTTR